MKAVAYFLTILHLTVISIKAEPFNDKNYVYVTTPFFLNLSPLISTNLDILISSHAKHDSIPFLSYHSYLQTDIVKALRTQGLQALPDITNSDFQLMQNFEYMSEIEDFLKTERDVFQSKPTIIPIMKSAYMYSKKEEPTTRTTLKIEIYIYTPGNELKSAGELAFSDTTLIDTTKIKTVSERLSIIVKGLSKKVIESHEWGKIIRSREFSDLKKKTSFKISSILPVNGDKNSYFLLSDAILKEKFPLARLLKVNFYTNQKRVSDLENEVIEFNYAKEIPVKFIGYIIKPNNEIVYIEESNLKTSTNQSSNSFTANSKLTINLEGLQPGCIVSYCCIFADTYYMLKCLQPEFKPPLQPLSQDMDIPITSTTDKWLFRASLPIMDTLNYLVGDSSEIKSKQAVFASQRVWTFTISNTDSNYVHDNFLRISTVPTWNQLLKPMADSVNSKIIPIKKVSARKKMNEEELQTAIFSAIDFLQDSVRYFSIEYGPKAFVPEPEDSVYKKRQSDCKSNSVVIINNLHRYGFDALPALVHSYQNNRIDRAIPSYDAFNHMVVYVPDFDWWIDPTYGKNPIWMKPNNLAGTAAMVFYQDSMLIKHIPYNSDNDGIDTISYTYDVKDKAINCIVKEFKSYSSSFAYLNWIANLDPSEITSAIVKRNLEVDSNKVFNASYTLNTLGKDKKRLIVTKNYTVTGNQKNIGNSLLFKWPETPIYTDDYLNDNTDTSSLETYDENFDWTFNFTFITNKKVSWANLTEYENDLFGLKILRKDDNNLSFRIFVKSGLVASSQRTTYNKMLNSFGEFFNDELILN